MQCIMEEPPYLHPPLFFSKTHQLTWAIFSSSPRLPKPYQSPRLGTLIPTPPPSKNGDGVVSRVNESDPGGLPDVMLLRIIDCQDDRHPHVNDGPVIQPERVKMKSLEELGFSHESAERACPALAQYVHPLQVVLRQPDSRKRHRLPFRILHKELHQLAAIRFDQTCPDPDSDPDPFLSGIGPKTKRNRQFRGGDEMGSKGTVQGGRKERCFGKKGKHWRN
ncbi:hypothetical protein SLEP1_g14711 [Rubroshorea leprosula]|uniref:Uncharacterized protein n=1 Tax=Rubroshorea leprosula TaxID=152421 RepID=A0AAV5IQW0_9ROSI|nr:hypothetical protein SLEP1_g14711 [Rubroshorea leprosula]